MGFIAGPDNPPILLAKTGWVVSMSIFIARTVLMATMASAPALTPASAICTMSATLGVNFNITGFDNPDKNFIH